MSEREIRGGLPAEMREDGEGIRVAGYAAVFNQETTIAGEFVERIAPGAFAEAIGRDDVVFLVNHEGLPLARTRSGTLALAEDEKGLRIETVLDAADPDVQRVAGKMRRGDLDKMSFAFWVERDQWDRGPDMPVRTIEKVRLADVSIVNVPAYEGTSIALRSLEAARAGWRAENYTAAARRIRMKMHLALAEREKGAPRAR